MLRFKQQPGLKNQMKDRKNQNEYVIRESSFQVFPLSEISKCSILKATIESDPSTLSSPYLY